VFETGAWILLLALIADWLLGEPDVLWSRFPHPVVIFGKAIGEMDTRLNRQRDGAWLRRQKGAIMIVSLIVASGIAGSFMHLVFSVLPLGWLLEAFVVFTLLAQKSLHDHVSNVADGLSVSLQESRNAVAMIVGRDTAQLDQSDVVRAGLESLAENFSDGVVAPAFWYLVAGLPGLFAYKMINTADSMVGYRNEKYAAFGWASAKLDDIANWLPARFSALILCVASFSRKIPGYLQGAMRDAPLHISPNAGWPEAAFAHVQGIAFGGPRAYGGSHTPLPWLNSLGRKELTVYDLRSGLKLFYRACLVLWGTVLMAIIGL